MCTGCARDIECNAGFFADKEADAKARGEDKNKKSKEEEFSGFMSSIAVDVREASSPEHPLELNAPRSEVTSPVWESGLCDICRL